MHPLCRRGHGDGTCLSHQGPGRGGGRTQHFTIPGTLPLGRVGGGAPNLEVRRDLGGGQLEFFRIHESADGEEKGLTHSGLGRSLILTGGLGSILHGVPWI